MDINEAVIEEHMEMACAVTNAGTEAQLEFLRSRGWAEDDLSTLTMSGDDDDDRND
jgi:hypothetical protein